MDYEKKYKEALETAKAFYRENKDFNAGFLHNIFPELKENEDERIRLEIRNFIWEYPEKLPERDKWIAWLEKQGEKKIDNSNTMFNACINALRNVGHSHLADWLEKQSKETSWKPSKEEMDVLYGLAYITSKYDEHKEEVITRLYQDLKREFFNGSSYENMFPNTEDDVRRRSTIQVLEYARSLDTYNQYGKADIDKNIAWLEKQDNKLDIDKVIAWLVANICDFEYYVKRFKEDFELC